MLAYAHADSQQTALGPHASKVPALPSVRQIRKGSILGGKHAGSVRSQGHLRYYAHRSETKDQRKQSLMQIYDVSVPISARMPTYPGDPGVTIREWLSLDKGDPANVTLIDFGAHTGTHVDAPPPISFKGAANWNR